MLLGDLCCGESPLLCPQDFMFRCVMCQYYPCADFLILCGSKPYMSVIGHFRWCTFCITSALVLFCQICKHNKYFRDFTHELKTHWGNFLLIPASKETLQANWHTATQWGEERVCRLMHASVFWGAPPILGQPGQQTALLVLALHIFLNTSEVHLDHHVTLWVKGTAGLFVARPCNSRSK